MAPDFAGGGRLSRTGYAGSCRSSIVAVALATTLGGCATLPPIAPRPAAMQAIAPDRREGAMPAAASADGVSYVFHRPFGCRRLSKWHERNVQACEGDTRMRVTLGDDGRVGTAPANDAPPRDRYPGELVHQWRHCPYAPDPALDARPDRFARYEDPDVGTCYLYRPTDAAALERLSGPARLGSLDRLHPVLADATRQLVLRAAEAGIDLKVISTVRPHSVRSRTSRVTGRDGRVRTVVRKTRATTLHAWGLAVDVNLAHRRDLASATAAFRQGGPERAAWERAGRIGEELGLLWLGRLRPTEIFHFEWRPGLSGIPKGAEKRRLQRAQARGGNAAVWELLRYDPKRPTAFRDLRDPAPDVPAGTLDGPRAPPLR